MWGGLGWSQGHEVGVEEQEEDKEEVEERKGESRRGWEKMQKEERGIKPEHEHGGTS